MTGVNASRIIPRVPTEARRPAPAPVPLWAPDGTMEMTLPSNVRDRIRLNGYRLSPGGEQAVEAHDPHAQPSDAGLDAIAALADGGDGDDDAQRPETPKLDSLRAELVALGGDPLPTMGIRSLNAAIAAAKEAETVPRGTVSRKGQEAKPEPRGSGLPKPKESSNVE